MLRVGLTGGIGCGKSTVAAMMRALGCHVIEADALAHKLIEPGQPAFQEVVRAFAADILDSDGRVDRARLGAIVFADVDKLLRLNSIVHPRVLKELERLFSEHAVMLHAAFPNHFFEIDGAIRAFDLEAARVVLREAAAAST